MLITLSAHACLNFLSMTPKHEMCTHRFSCKIELCSNKNQKPTKCWCWNIIIWKSFYSVHQTLPVTVRFSILSAKLFVINTLNFDNLHCWSIRHQQCVCKNLFIRNCNESDCHSFSLGGICFIVRYSNRTRWPIMILACYFDEISFQEWNIWFLG